MTHAEVVLIAFLWLCAAARETLEQPAVAPRRRRKRKSVQQLLPVVQEQRPVMSEGVRIGLLGVGALGAMAAAYYVGRRLMSTQLPKVQKVRSSVSVCVLQESSRCLTAANGTSNSLTLVISVCCSFSLPLACAKDTSVQYMDADSGGMQSLRLSY